MAKSRSDEIRGEVCRVLKDMVPERIGLNDNFDNRRNLLEVLDSFQFVCLTMNIEEALGVQIDRRNVDLASIVHLDDLANFIHCGTKNSVPLT